LNKESSKKENIAQESPKRCSEVNWLSEYRTPVGSMNYAL